MPRKASVSYAKIYKVLKGMPVFKWDGTLHTLIQPVWTDACQKLDNKILPKNLYMKVFKNFDNLQQRLKKYAIKKKQINPKLKTSESEIESASESSEADDSDTSENTASNSDCECNESDSDKFSDSDTDNSLEVIKDADGKFICHMRKEKNMNPLNCEPLNFTIHIDKDVWLKIKPINSKKLPGSKWTPKIFRAICEYDKRLICPYSFKVGTVYSLYNSSKYFDFYGRCKDKKCNTYFYGVCKEKPKDEDEKIAIHICTFNTRNVKHGNSKRFVIGDERKEAKEKLKHMSASNFKNQLARKFMDFSQIEPPDFPSDAVARNMRKQGIDEDIDLDGPIDIRTNLLYQKKKQKKNYIRSIISYPFQVSYWFDEQVKLNDRLMLINPIVYFDATGSKMNTVALNLQG
ncbi:hypothetical protein TKK_0009194 [Trichogramma kaykai]